VLHDNTGRQSPELGVAAIRAVSDPDQRLP